jgi:hypothetical protein
MILGDYPPEHRSMDPDWPEEYINNYLIPQNRSDSIRPKAVLGIQRESVQICLDEDLEIPVFVNAGIPGCSFIFPITLSGLIIRRIESE